MNASANSQAISDKLTAVTCYSKQHGLVKYSKAEMNLATEVLDARTKI